MNKKIFRSNLSSVEEEAHGDILGSEHRKMSSVITGGAGVGKTLLMIKKVAQEDSYEDNLVVSRLPRLVSCGAHYLHRLGLRFATY